jgi:hypothetical protein
VKGSFKGRVTSAGNKCVGGRNVVLFQVQHKKGTPVGHDTTDGAGHWKVSHLSDVHGKFYASVKKSKVTSGTCKSAKSKTVSR